MTKLVVSFLPVLLLGSSPAEAEPSSSTVTRCQAIIGDEAVRAANARERRRHPLELAPGPHAMTLLHNDEKLRAPDERVVQGIEVRRIRRAPRADATGDATGDSTTSDSSRRDSSKYVAQIRLSEPLEERCGAERVALQVDDALGVNGRVAAIVPQGVLAEIDGELLWVPRSDRGEPDDRFRMVWRSNFELAAESAVVPTTSSVTSRQRSLAAKRRAMMKKRAILKKRRAAFKARRAKARNLRR